MSSCVQLFVIPWTVALQAPLSMGFPSKSTGAGCHSLLQGIFPTQGWNLGLLLCRRILHHWCHLGSQIVLGEGLTVNFPTGSQPPSLFSLRKEKGASWILLNDYMGLCAHVCTHTHALRAGLPWWLSGRLCPPGQETRVLFLGQEDPLEEDMATHFSIPAWRILENPTDRGA